MDTLILARFQMAFTLYFHIIFSCFAITFPLLLFFAEIQYFRTRDIVYINLVNKWIKAIVVLFAVGAVTGTLISVELGTLWPKFMEFASPIFGLPFSIEGFAFFFEMIFLAIYAYARDKVPAIIRLISAFGISLCSATSGFVVIAANGWMNQPTGFELDAAGNAINIDVVQAMMNEPFISMSVHMILAAFQTAGFIIMAVYAFLILKNGAKPIFKKALTIAMIVSFGASIIQVLAGDVLAKRTCRDQELKCAAMEAHYETEKGAPLRLGGVVLEEEERIAYDIKIPKAFSILAKNDANAEVKGIKELAPNKEDRPPVAIVHTAFQLMIISGTLMFLLAVIYVGTFLWRGFIRPRISKDAQADLSLPLDRPLLWTVVMAAPLGLVAMWSGWTVTEVGRQPWVIKGIMRTSEAVTVAPIMYQSIAFILIFILLTVVLLYTLYHILIKDADKA